MKLVITNTPLWIGAGAITVYPFGCFVTRRLQRDKKTLAHEQTHWEQQRDWYEAAWVPGLLAWFFLYLCVLPVYWNPWRRAWETEAYSAQGKTLGEIRDILTRKPYYLRKTS